MNVKDLSLYKENGSDYLSAVIQYEDENGFYEAAVPKIAFPTLNNIQLNQECYYDKWGHPYKYVSVDFGSFTLQVIPDIKGTFFTVNCLEEKVRQMTLAEIEKELGYKIELKKDK